MKTDHGSSEDVRRKHHAGCMACGSQGLGLQFELQSDGSVQSTFDCAPTYQGYQDRLHGGVVATLADAAMTHCLFSRGIAAFTAKLEITFRHPVMIGRQALVRAWLERETGVLYELRAEVFQTGRVCATARGLFAPAGDQHDDEELENLE